MTTVLDFLENSVKKNASLDRAFLLMEYDDWDKAGELLENVLNEDPRNCIAYLGKVMIKEKAFNIEGLVRMSEETKNSPDYLLMVRFADDDVKAVLNAIEEKRLEKEKEAEVQKQKTIQKADNLAFSTKENDLKEAISLYNSLGDWQDSRERAEKTEKKLQDFETVYVRMIDRFNESTTDEDYLEVVKHLQQIGEYKHAKQIVIEAEKRAKEYKEQQLISKANKLMQRGDLNSLKEAESIYASITGQEAKLSECRRRIEGYCTLQYSEALRLMAENKEESYKRAIRILNRIPGWRDAQNLVKQCEEGILALKEKEKEEQEKKQRRPAEAEENKDPEEHTISDKEGEFKKGKEKPAEKDNKNSKAKRAGLLGALLIVGCGLVYCFTTPLHSYLEAKWALRSGDYDNAKAIFSQLGDYKDSDAMVNETTYLEGCQKLENKDYVESQRLFEQLGDYKDSIEKKMESTYQYGLLLANDGRYNDAIDIFNTISNYKESQDYIYDCKYSLAMEKASQGTVQGYWDAMSLLKGIGKYKDSYSQYKHFRCEMISGFCKQYFPGIKEVGISPETVGKEILYSIKDEDVRNIVMQYPEIGFYCLSLVDYRYVDIALYYWDKSNIVGAEMLTYKLHFISLWCGTYYEPSSPSATGRVTYSDDRLHFEGFNTSFCDSADRTNIYVIDNGKNWTNTGQVRVLVRNENDDMLLYSYDLYYSGKTITAYIDRNDKADYIGKWHRRFSGDVWRGFDPIDIDLWNSTIYSTIKHNY